MITHTDLMVHRESPASMEAVFSPGGEVKKSYPRAHHHHRHCTHVLFRYWTGFVTLVEFEKVKG